MTVMKRIWLLVLVVLGASTGCASSGAIGPHGYAQETVKYRLRYDDASKQRFLPEDWQLDNYEQAPGGGSWNEKFGKSYRATRELDENGDGNITPREKSDENLFDLRFSNSRDNSVIWLKAHPLPPTAAKRDLDVVLENYTTGLEGTGLFEQSSMFGTETTRARNFTTFIVDRKPIWLGQLAALRGTVEVADVEKLRIDSSYRSSKATLVFARVTSNESIGAGSDDASRWPLVVDPATGETVRQRTGLLVVGYWSDAKRFDSHLADFDALLARLEFPPSAIPPKNELPVLEPRAPEAAPASPATPIAPAAPSPTPAPAAVSMPQAQK